MKPAVLMTGVVMVVVSLFFGLTSCINNPAPVKTTPTHFASVRLIQANKVMWVDYSAPAGSSLYVEFSDGYNSSERTFTSPMVIDDPISGTGSIPVTFNASGTTYWTAVVTLPDGSTVTAETIARQ